MSWSARQYVAFEDERTRPARDLLAAIPPVDARLAIDIGCGPGNSTQLLVERFANATVRGLDSSVDMIEAARQRLPQVRFDTADIDTWNEPGPFDVIFANAVLQWLPDHATLLPALASRLTQGGSLAIQMPDNLNEPSHRLMREVAADGPWVSKLADAAGQRTEMASASDYYSMLRPHSTCGAPPIITRSQVARRGWSSGSRAADCGRFSIHWMRWKKPTSSSSTKRRSSGLIRP